MYNQMQYLREKFFKSTANKATSLVFLNILVQNIISIPIFIMISIYFTFTQGAIGNYVYMNFIQTPELIWGLSIFTSVAGVVIPYAIIRKKVGVKNSEVFRQKAKLPLIIFIFLFVLISGINGANMYLSYLFESMFKSVGIALNDPIQTPTSVLGLVFFSIAVVIIAPIFEEIMFRGLMLHALKRYGNFLAVLVSSLFFGLIHGNLYQIPFTFLVGIILGYATIKTGSIKTAVGLHMLNNGFVTIQAILLAVGVPYVNEVVGVMYNVFLALSVIFLLVKIITRKKIDWATPYGNYQEENHVIPINHKYSKLFLTPCAIISIIFCVGMVISSIFFM